LWSPASSLDSPLLGRLGRIRGGNQDTLSKSAKVNNRENFALEFDSALTEMFIDRMDQNKELFAEFMHNDEVQEVITEHLRHQVYQESQEAEG
jgi:type I restriction enzyme R subunit